MNEKTTIDERIEFVDKAKFTDSSSRNEIHERQCMIFTFIASSSLHMRYTCAIMILSEKLESLA